MTVTGVSKERPGNSTPQEPGREIQGSQSAGPGTGLALGEGFVCSVGVFIWRIHTCHENCPITSHSHTYVTDLVLFTTLGKYRFCSVKEFICKQQRNEQMTLKVLPNALILRLSLKIHTKPVVYVRECSCSQIIYTGPAGVVQWLKHQSTLVPRK